MWSGVITKPKQVKALRKDGAVLMNCPVDYEDSENWEDIDMLAGVPNPDSFPYPKTEK